MKRFLILTVLLICLPFTVKLKAAEAGGALKAGVFMEKGQTSAFAVTTGTNLVVVSKDTLKTRITNFTGLFHANTSDEIEGATNLTYLSIYRDLTPRTELVVSLGSGLLYDIKDAENEISPAVAFDIGVVLYKWVALGVTNIYVPKDGPDQFFFGLTVDLLNPL